MLLHLKLVLQKEQLHIITLQKDVFLDDTPVLNASAENASPATTDFNFQDVTFKTKFGTSIKTAMSGIPSESRSSKLLLM